MEGNGPTKSSEVAVSMNGEVAWIFRRNEAGTSGISKRNKDMLSDVADSLSSALEQAKGELSALNEGDVIADSGTASA